MLFRSYFNLAGYSHGTILDHILCLHADSYLQTDEGLIPTGIKAPVEGTPFDFRQPKTVGAEFWPDERSRDMQIAGGYDHCFNFVGGESAEPVLRATLYDPNSGREMKVITNQPCVQFYSGNFLDDADFPLKGGYPQNKQSMFCLETQKMPDAINHSNFDNVVLCPGEVYDYTTVYQFSVKS